MSPKASLCFLSYNRPTRLLPAIHSAVSNAGVPVEVIVHDDGSHTSVQQVIVDLFHDESVPVSNVMLNPPGHNEGVGKAINRSFAAARGDYLVKIDQDMVFEADWLKKVIGWMEDDHWVGMFGVFKYHCPPCRWQDMLIREVGEYQIVKDFVSSVFVVRRNDYENRPPFEEHSDAFAEDVMYKSRLRADGYDLAIPNIDLAQNLGFGIGEDRSTIVSGDHGAPTVTKIQHGPKVFAS